MRLEEHSKRTLRAWLLRILGVDLKEAERSAMSLKARIKRLDRNISKGEGGGANYCDSD